MIYNFDLYCICYLACRNAALHNRKIVAKNDILIGFKRYKYGYMDFSPPDVVVNVYNDVFKIKRLPVFEQLEEGLDESI